jgi:integrase
MARGHVQEVGRGVWRVYIEDGRDPITGRRRRVPKTVHGTRKDAENEAARLITRA